MYVCVCLRVRVFLKKSRVYFKKNKKIKNSLKYYLTERDVCVL